MSLLVFIWYKIGFQNHDPNKIAHIGDKAQLKTVHCITVV